MSILLSQSRKQRPMIYLGYFFVVILFLTGCEFPPVSVVTSNESTIQINVWDDRTQRPISRAEVSLNLPQQVFPVKFTDNAGRAIFEVNNDLLDGISEIVIRKDGYQTQTHAVMLANTPLFTTYLVPIGATPVPREPTDTPIPPTIQSTNTNTPTPTNTAVPTRTPTATAVQIFVATPSEALSTPQTTATAVLSASIFTQPNVNSEVLAFIDIGESVLVLDQQGSWIIVRNDEGVEGWAAKNRFQSPSEEIIAVVNQSVTIFSGPGENYSQITFLNPGTEVTVLGRSANASWLNIFTADLIEGWVAVSRMTLDRDISEIPVVDESVITSLNEVPGDLTLDFWGLDGSIKCTSSGWEVSLFLEGHGGNGSYTYFVNGIKVAGSKSGSYTYSFNGGGNASVIISGRVTSGDGYSTSKNILISPPTCN